MGRFKMMLRPRITAGQRGGFKKARGCGTIELRCLDVIAGSSLPVTYRIWIGNPACTGKQLPPRGPVNHDFAQQAVCGLPKPDEWNFARVVDRETDTFVVVLEVLPGG